MLQGFASFAVTEMLGTLGTYVLAAAMIAGGIYIAGFADISDKSPLYPFVRPIRQIGMVLAAAGLVLGCAGYFKHVGAEQCEAAWKEKNLEARIAELEQDRDAWKVAADSNSQSLRELAQTKRSADNEIVAYRETIKVLPQDVARCRIASSDDRRRLCDIVGNRAPGCEPAKLRPAGGRPAGHR